MITDGIPLSIGSSAVAWTVPSVNPFYQNEIQRRVVLCSLMTFLIEKKYKLGKDLERH